LAQRVAVDLFRVAGIYGPGRSIIDDLRTGRARRVIKPGHAFGRIHRDDIAGAVVAAMNQHPKPGVRVLHLADDEPQESATVTAYAAELLAIPAPPAITYAEALPNMGEMARSFWADNRKVASKLTQEMLGHHWRYPTYREGLAAILAEERGEG
jgi:nucleoside-diphosphate-sugar epimerase